MSDIYTIEGEEALGSALQSILQITNVTTARARIRDFNIGAAAVSGDFAGEYGIERFTVAPTDTTVTPRPVDPGAPAAIHSDCGENGGTTGTFAGDTEIWRGRVHFRAAYRWVAYDELAELVVSAVSANGVAWRGLHATETPLIIVNAFFSE